MGVFDYVDYEAPCPKCGRILTRDCWQSKEGFCIMETIKPEAVDVFYGYCLKIDGGCGTCIKATVEAERTCTLKSITLTIDEV